jgi:putative SOS response-associated peptidase YedK
MLHRFICDTGGASVNTRGLVPAGLEISLAVPGRLDAWPVSTAVNNVRNNGAELVVPLPAE